MIEIGEVIGLDDQLALVSIKRNSACGDCGKCQMSKDQSIMEMMAKNTINAKVGDKVEVEMQFASVFKAASIMYGIPLIAFVVGSCIAFLLIVTMNLSWDQVLVPFLSGLIFLGFSYGGIKYFDKKGIFESKYQAVVIDIIENKEIKKSV
jgi:sigma-E factor negative regulatory protein RseC